MSIISEDTLNDICLSVRKVFLAAKNDGHDKSSLITKNYDKLNFCCKKWSQEFCLKLMEFLRKDKIDNNDSPQDENERQKLNSMLSGDLDVIPNQYEGGFKIWEGLFDLINYLHSNNFLHKNILSSLSSKTTKQDLTVLDLGCGSGLLSIYIVQQLKQLCPEVNFKIFLQDYNEHVIKLFTVPNILVNELKTDSLLESNESILKTVRDQIHQNYRFVFGEWVTVHQMFLEQATKFDLIITSETIYNEENYSTLFNIFQDCLRWPNGLVLIASKSHYFGVGGGTYTFLDYIDERQQQRQEFVSESDNYQPKKKRNKIENKDHSTTSIDADGSKRQELCSLKADIVDEIHSTLLRHIIQLKWSTKE